MRHSESKEDIQETKRAALNLLARREHSAYELQQKLLLKGYAKDDIVLILKELQQANLLSEQRFTESYIRYRSERGYGPLRLRSELMERGISPELIDVYLDEGAEEWLELVRQVRDKRFGSTPPKDFSEQAKQMRFLQQRGFTFMQIKQLF